jgi:RNA polymerase sigma-70 factor (ECF subfamily)
MDVTSVVATVDGDFEFTESLEIPLNSTLDFQEVSQEVCGNETDIELVKKSAQGNIAAFEQIYLRHHRRIYSLCLRMMANPVEAEDMMQEVFIQLYRKIGSFRGDSQFTTWLHRLTVNQVLMYFRRKNVKIEKMTEDEEFPEQVILGTENPRKMQIVDKIAIDEAIEQLPTGYRRF